MATTEIYTYCHTLSLHDALPILCRIWLRNSLVRDDCGLLKNSSGSFSSMISPPSMKITRLATLRAKPISRSEEHTSELQSLMRNSYAVFYLKKKTPLPENS